MTGMSSFGQDIQDYKTYSIVLEEFLRQDGADKQLIIIHQESDTLFLGGDPGAPQFMASLDSLMKRQIKFSNKFQIKGWESIVITHQEFRLLTVDENGDWIDDALYKKYPKAEGVIFLSPIYYTNKNKTTGLLQIEIRRTSLSAGCFLVKFDVKKKRKKIKRTLTEVA